jgi:hypothetical protein
MRFLPKEFLDDVPVGVDHADNFVPLFILERTSPTLIFHLPRFKGTDPITIEPPRISPKLVQLSDQCYSRWNGVKTIK